MLTDDLLPSEVIHLPEQEILACLPCGIVVLNTQGIIVWLNNAAKDLLGADFTKALWFDVIQQVFAPRADDGHEVSLVDGRRVSVAISSLTALPGQLVTLTDLTTTRDYEQAKANQGRLMTIGRMTAQLAHQIRTPLSSAILYTDHLMQRVDDTRCVQWLIRLQDCHASIEQQIEDLLLFARGEALELTLTDLQDWSTQLYERACPVVEAQQAVLQFDNQLPKLPYLLHAESLSGALLNLINNALEAGANVIGVRLRYLQERLVIQVIDNGPGFDEDTKGQAFAPFFTTKAQGTGLGLAVVQAVAKAHGGEVSLDSSPGAGCCVTISFT